MSQTLLIVEDEISIREPLVSYLERNGFRVKEAADASQARALLTAHTFDLVVSDIMMPGEDGISLCRHIRETTKIPVLFLTAKAEEIDRIIGLELGADDYLTKPFNPRELLARVRAVLRRVNELPPQKAEPQSDSLAFGDWVLKTGPRELTNINGETATLSTGEYNLLVCLLERPNIVLSREQLLDLTKGRDASPFDRSIDNQISRLRRKLEPDPKNPRYVQTVWGGGYRFGEEVREL